MGPGGSCFGWSVPFGRIAPPVTNCPPARVIVLLPS
jgi:hypothetical protein